MNSISANCFQIYVEYVARNPLCPLNDVITSKLFENKLDAFMAGLSFFEGTE